MEERSSKSLGFLEKLVGDARKYSNTAATLAFCMITYFSMTECGYKKQIIQEQQKEYKIQRVHKESKEEFRDLNKEKENYDYAPVFEKEETEEESTDKSE